MKQSLVQMFTMKSPLQFLPNFISDVTKNSFSVWLVILLLLSYNQVVAQVSLSVSESHSHHNSHSQADVISPNQIGSSLFINESEFHIRNNESLKHTCSKFHPRLQSSTPISLPTEYKAQNFDVLHYNAIIDFTNLPQPITKSVCGIRYRWIGTPDTFRFHLRSLIVDSIIQTSTNFPSRRLVTVLQRGTPADPTFHYAVPAQSTDQVGDTINLQVYYSGTMTGEPLVNNYTWGGVQRDEDGIYALGVCFFCNYVSATQHWLPCYDHPSDKATASFVFITDPSYKVASNGTLVNDTVINNKRNSIWSMKDPSATYLLTFSAQKYTAIKSLHNGIPYTLYSLPRDTASTRISFKLLPRMVDTYSKLFIPYPFEKVGYMNTDKGAMEHQTMIAYPKGLAQSRDTVNLVGAHELAHQWFGDYVSPFDFRDAWLTESFATFSESLWMEELRGNSGYLIEQQNKINSYIFQYARPGNPYFEGMFPIYDFNRKLPSSNYPRTIYEKGAVVLGMLRYHIGDSAFFGALRSYLRGYALGNATIDTIEQEFTRATPQVLRTTIRPFFDEWIRGKGWAVLQINALKSKSDNGWSADLSITQIQPDSMGIYTVLPVELSFRDKSNNVIHRVVNISGKTLQVKLDSLNDYTVVNTNSGIKVRSLVQVQPITISSVENEYSEQLSVYPQPANDVLWVTNPVRTSRWYITDILGCVSLSGTIDGSNYQPNTSSKSTIDISTLPQGSYTLVVVNGVELKSHSFIIVR
jgi:aminopeptidase N